jgi:hypothetical protein
MGYPIPVDTLVLVPQNKMETVKCLHHKYTVSLAQLVIVELFKLHVTHSSKNARIQ